MSASLIGAILSAGLAAVGVADQAAWAAPPAGPLTNVPLMQITLPARDLARSVAFYKDVLGLKLQFQVKGAAFFDAGSIRLRLEQSGAPLTGAPVASPPVTGGSVELYFDDPGLSKAKPLEARGVRFAGPPETVQHLKSADVQLLEFTDPDGNALALMGEVPRPDTKPTP